MCSGSASFCSAFTLLGLIDLLSKYLNADDNYPRLPLHIVVTRFIQHALVEPYCRHCPTCSGTVKVQSLSIPEMSWLWIKLSESISPVSPSPHLVFDVQDQHQEYTLQAIILVVVTTSPRGFSIGPGCGGSMMECGNQMCYGPITSKMRWISSRTTTKPLHIYCILRWGFMIEHQLTG